MLRKLGKTDLLVSEIGFGTWGVGGDRGILAYGPTVDAVSLRSIETALEIGCTLFDTADCYGRGHSEELLGQTLQNRRQRAVICTKAGFDFYGGDPVRNYQPAYLRFALHQSLRRLKTDHVDIFLLHNPTAAAMHDPALISELLRLKREGKTRSVGISAETVLDAGEALNAGWAEVIQLPYNMLDAEASWFVIPHAALREVGVMAREPLANGFLTGKYGRGAVFPPGDIRGWWPPEVVDSAVAGAEALNHLRRPGESLAQSAIRFVLQTPGVSCVVCGCKTPTQVKDNFSTSYGKSAA